MDGWPASQRATSWTRVRVTVPATKADLAVDALWLGGAAGIEERDAGADQTLIAGFDDSASAVAAAADLQRRGFAGAAVEPVDDTRIDQWRDFARPAAAGPLWLVPAWTPPPPDVDPRRILVLEPGATFGSGSHPTTRLMVRLLAKVLRDGDRVLDVGCGSGVLAVAAARLGAGSVVGIDIDPACAGVLEANAERNGHRDRILWSGRTIAGLVADGDQAEVVAANLLAPVIVEHARALTSLVAPGGTLLVSGLLERQRRPALEALAPLEPRGVIDDDGWVAIALAERVDPER